MKSPIISVIVPIYNAGKYLHRCINSILAQTFTNFELLLVNDGSTDNSKNICEYYAVKDLRIRVFHKKNGGVSSARNLGLTNVKGELITFVDADDWIESDCLELFMKNTNELTCLSFQSFYEGKKELWDTSIYNANNIKEYIIELYNKEILGYVWGKLYKQEIIQKHNIKFNEQVRFREDELFVLDYLTYITEVTYIDKKCYNYNRPNWIKYSNYDDYKIRILLYKRYKAIFSSSNYITDRFLLDLVGYIINQYNLNKSNYKVFKEIQKETKLDINRLQQISIITRFLWENFTLITHIYLKIKSKIFRK